MSRPRRCYEPGHRPKFLVVADDTPEADRALYFAARRAARVGATVTLLGAYGANEFQHWFGVGDLMKEEAEAEVKAQLARFAARVRDIAGIEAETIVRQGERAEALGKLIDEDEDIALLVLAADPQAKSPGPLVGSIAGEAAGGFPIPIAIVPGHLSDAEIDGLA